jgi:uncharacterized protein
MKRFAPILFAAAAVFGGVSGVVLTERPAYAQALSSLTIQSGDKTHAFNVELADTPSEREKGLMFRESLPPDGGMLFDFGEPAPASIWMKNTLIPLDILFIDARGEIVAIARNAVPGSLRQISPGVPVRGVLEIAGGRAAALGVSPGDTVVHPIFRPASNGG